MKKTAPVIAPRRGRPPMSEGKASTFVGTRMSPEQAEKLKRLGGAAWIRDRIDRAREAS